MKTILLLFIFSVSFISLSQDTTSVLFIGNSFTFYNNMPFIFKDIATSKGKNVIVDTCVSGGKDLNFHSKRARTYQMIKARKWDYVILQGHSNEFAQPDSKVDTMTFPYAKQIIDSIRLFNPCTRVNLYMTWGYKNGNKKWKPIATYDSMQMRIESQYLRFADKLNTGVHPVGMVWKEVRESNPEINLYHEDRFHPILSGSYLSACTHFTTIFGETPYKNTAQVDLDSFQREVIEIAATKTVLNNLARWRYLPVQRPLETGFDIIQNGNTIQLVNYAKNYYAFTWDFGDGTTSSEPNTSYQYKTKGEYIITQRIAHNCKQNSLQRKIIIN